MQFDFLYSLGIIPTILKTLDITVTLSVVSFVLALFIAMVFTIIKFYDLPILSKLVSIYVSFFRGSPLVVQMFIIYYGLPQAINLSFFKDLSAYDAAVISLTLHFCAYMTEVLRGAILSIPKGQIEASESISLSKTTMFVFIIFPQMMRLALQSLMNIFADIIKSTSLVFLLGITEIMATAKIEAANSFKYFESYVVVAIVYWVTISMFAFIQQMMEIRLNKGFK